MVKQTNSASHENHHNHNLATTLGTNNGSNANTSTPNSNGTIRMNQYHPINHVTNETNIHIPLPAPPPPPRASPRLAEKIQRQHTQTQRTTTPTPHTHEHEISQHKHTNKHAHENHESVPGSPLFPGSTVVSAASSPSLPPSSGNSIHTPLSKRGVAGCGSRLQTPLSHHVLTPSPISLPPPSVQSARRKLLSGGSSSKSLANGFPSSSFSNHHGLPPSRADSPMSVRRDISPNAIMVRSVSCPSKEPYHTNKLPCHQADGVSFVTPRTAALIMLAMNMKQEQGGNNASTALVPILHIPHLTMAEHELLSQFRTLYDRLHVLDARFPYEFRGGHIRGAMNVTSHEQAEELFMKDIPIRPTEEEMNATNTNADHSSANMTDDTAPIVSSSTPTPTGSRVCILIHCEFSRHRGPKCFQFLRKRDREIMGIEHFPSLHYPELYVIQGGYQSFFHGGYQSFCTPQEYVSMLDRRFLKEYSEHWKKMRRSTSIGTGTTGSMSQTQKEKENAGEERQHHGNISSPLHFTLPRTFGSGSSTPDCDPASGGGSGHSVPSRRNSRTRSWSEMDSPSSASTTPIRGQGGLQPRNLAFLTSTGHHTGSGSTQQVPTPTSHSTAGASPIPSHPRVSRGLSLALDSSAASGVGGNSNGQSAGSIGGISTRRSSAFSFASSAASPKVPVVSSSTSNGASTGTIRPTTGRGSGLFMPLVVSTNTNTTQVGSLSPSMTPSTSNGPCPSPSPSYGWSLEGRSSTPSPFQALNNGAGGDSPRFRSTASSPMPLLLSPGLNGMSGGSGMNNMSMPPPTPPSPMRTRMRAHSLTSSSAGSSTSAMQLVLSQQHQMPPPLVFTNLGVASMIDESVGTDLLNVPATNPNMFDSPRLASHGYHSQNIHLSMSVSPSSAFHGMQLRSSPTPSATSSISDFRTFSPSLSLVTSTSSSSSSALCGEYSDSDSPMNSSSSGRGFGMNLSPPPTGSTVSTVIIAPSVIGASTSSSVLTRAREAAALANASAAAEKEKAGNSHSHRPTKKQRRQVEILPDDLVTVAAPTKLDVTMQHNDDDAHIQTIMTHDESMTG